MLDLTTLEGRGHSGPGACVVCSRHATVSGGIDAADTDGCSCVRVSAAWFQWRGQRWVTPSVLVASVATAFPSGQSSLELATARDRGGRPMAGADEIDMVISRGLFLSGRYRDVVDEIRMVS